MFSYVLKVKVEETFSYVILQMKLNHLELDTYRHMFSGHSPGMYIVVKYKIHLYSLRNMPVSKACTNKFYI
jgi:hypothetical protein